MIKICSMFMKGSCIRYVFLMLMINLQAQSYKEYPPVIEDFNNDNVLDTLYSFYESGSTFGGTDIKIVNGKSNEVYKFSDFGCYCEMKRIYPIPALLSKPENKPFLSVIQKKLFSEPREKPDPSLEWIFKGYSSKKKIPENKYFNLIIYPEVNWDTEKIKIPDNYSLVLNNDTLNLLLNEEDSLFSVKDKTAFLSYCGNCHFYNKSSPELVVSDNEYKIYKTSHGIFVVKGDLQKWLLVNDLNLTGSPEKLRWDSILQVDLIDKYLIIQFSGAPDIFDSIYVGNIETGVLGRLKYPFRRNVEDYEGGLVIGDKIRYSDEEEESFFVSYNDVFKELERLYDNLKK
ncbi:hypothetical protein SAMN04487910_3616 [Aquimarina amphilecti]|uniref:Uncharacterized protein n=2 Tax=Aquimarina amphilecti TaxID=1038014 RepID=A0A1H7U978_AQUAM|nr:hypothetical protein SAMN04487910_3616 [Aquimarina amphilecti]